MGRLGEFALSFIVIVVVSIIMCLGWTNFVSGQINQPGMNVQMVRLGYFVVPLLTIIVGDWIVRQIFIRKYPGDNEYFHSGYSGTVIGNTVNISAIFASRNKLRAGKVVTAVYGAIAIAWWLIMPVTTDCRVSFYAIMHGAMWPMSAWAHTFNNVTRVELGNGYVYLVHKPSGSSFCTPQIY